MTIDRRDFLRKSGIGAVAIAGEAISFGVSYRIVRGYQKRRRDELFIRLKGDADPALQEFQRLALLELPMRAERDLEHRLLSYSLNAPNFVSAISHPDFLQDLWSVPTERRYVHLLNAFETHYLSSNDVFNAVKLTTHEIGNTLDTRWSSLCSGILGAWQLKLRDYASTISPRDLEDRCMTFLRSEFTSFRRTASTVFDHLCLSLAVHNFSQCVLCAIPIFNIRVGLILPTFAVEGLRTGFDILLKHLHERKAAAVPFLTQQITPILKNVCSEFRLECHSQIAALQDAQLQSLSIAAHERATQCTSWS